MRKKFMAFVVLLMASIVLLPTATALAAPELTVKVSAGLDGQAKEGKGAPVTLTIENTGTAFSGDVVVDMNYTYSMGTGEAFPLEIGAGETKTVSFVIQRMSDNRGMSSMSNTKTIFFYQDGWEKGKEIEHNGSQHITATLQSKNNKLSVQFTDNIDRLTALKKVNYSNILVDAAKIAATKFPEEVAGWGAANFIIIDEYPLADLSAKQQQALLGWVRDGGIMIFGGSDNSQAEAGLFADYLPLQLHGKTEMNTAALNTWAATKGFEGLIAAYETELLPHATILFEDEHNVLAAYKRLGEGLVIQTAFSVGDEPLATMEGMPAFWKLLFETAERANYVSAGTNPYEDDPMDTIISSIGNVNELFPSFKVSAPLILGIIICYMIVIIPVLYMILKKKDKREYTWWIIPAIALLTSIAIFAYGAKDRIGRAQIQHTAVLNVAHDESLTGYYAESLLTNKSGDFTFTAPTGTTLFTSSRRDDFFVSSTTIPIHNRVMLEKDPAGSTLQLLNEGFWDVATVYGQTTVEQLGTYASQLKIEDKKLTGTITNGFPFALTDVAIWSGSQLHPIGDLGPGQTVQVDKILQTNTLLPKRMMVNSYMNPQATNGDDLTQMRKDGIFEFAGRHMNKTAKPAIVGYTDTQIVPIELAKGKPAISSLTMIVQPIEVDVVFQDTLKVEPEMMTMSMMSERTQLEPQKMGLSGDEYFFNEPAYLQTWQLPEELNHQNLTWTSLEVSQIDQQLYEVSILNSQTGVYEQQDASQFTLTDRLGDYITADGEMVLRLLLKNVQNAGTGRAPELKLNGEVAK
ncbi:hypothetical protein [Sporosarcina sp. YIM B06819]|uniref:hypothetical protein n=1 Tax=Sporosarcina sp. YIM B06819 TaxID=3081769 RepID=UPI00298C2BAD|nr:hypothetical protein [Sporosarcina sp. YIM B06819]